MAVLVGYVPTPEGEAAFTTAVEEAQRRAEPLVVLNSPRSGAPISTEVATDDVVHAMIARAESSDVEIDVRQAPHEGDATEEVLRVAQELSASLIVIGIRRRTPLGKLLMGSTAQRILLESDCPVLAVKS